MRGGPLVVLALCAAACSATTPAIPDGSGGSGGGGAGGDGGSGGTAGQAGGCLADDRYCDGATVRRCDMGKPGAVVETCTEPAHVCAGGRCTTLICKEAEAKQSVVGCEFYAYDSDNANQDDGLVFDVVVGNPSPAGVAMVRVQRKVGAGGWIDEVAGAVAPGMVQVLRLALPTEPGVSVGKDQHIEGTGLGRGRAWRVLSDLPVVAYQVNSDDEFSLSSSSSSNILLPRHALGRAHYALTPPERGLGIDGGDKGIIAVVGSVDSTAVTVTPKGNVGAGPGVAALAPGDVFKAVLDEGDVLQLETAGRGDDLTGSTIESDRPVAVFAGTVCGGFDEGRTAGCDKIEEQMPPVALWGSTFVFTDLRMGCRIGMAIGCTDPSTAVWGRIVASEDATLITFDSPQAWPGLPAGMVTLNKGEFLHLAIPAPYDPARRVYFAIKATKPIMVGSFMGIEEGGALLVPVDQFLEEYLFSSHPWFQGYLLVTRKVGTVVTFDGTAMPDNVFQEAGGGFQAAFLQIAQGGHTVRAPGDRVGITVTANGGICNYSYAGGMGVRCVNMTAGCKL